MPSPYQIMQEHVTKYLSCPYCGGLYKSLIFDRLPFHHSTNMELACCGNLKVISITDEQQFLVLPDGVKAIGLCYDRLCDPALQALDFDTWSTANDLLSLIFPSDVKAGPVFCDCGAVVAKGANSEASHAYWCSLSSLLKE